jgi:hypothetical protein
MAKELMETQAHKFVLRYCQQKGLTDCSQFYLNNLKKTLKHQDPIESKAAQRALDWHNKKKERN